MSTPLAENSSVGPVEAYWRFRAWTVPITIVIGLLAGLFVLATSGTSTATTTMYLTDPRGTPVFRDGSSTPTDLDRYAHQRAEFADSAAVHTAVVESIDAQREALAHTVPPTPEGDLPQAETIESIDDAVTTGTTAKADVRIDCTADSEARAILICDEVVAAYLTLTEADTVERADATVAAFLGERERLVAEGGGQNTIDQIDLQIAEVRSEAALLGDGVEFVEPAEVQRDARILPALQYTIAALLFAAFGLAIVAWFRAGRRPVIATSSDATAGLDAPLLGEVTEAPPQLFDPIAPPGAAYQLLATSLGAVHPQGGVILTATAIPSHDASETVARLAVAAAREGRRVLVVDANLRDRRMSRLFGFEQAVGGLTELLAGLSTIDDVRRTVGVGGEATLDLVTGGRSVDDPAGLFRSQAARSTMHTLRDRYQLILVDVPPLLAVADGSALAGDSDGVVIIVARGTDATDLDIVRQRLDVLRGGSRRRRLRPPNHRPFEVTMSRRPLGAIISQMIVAGSSLLLSLVVLREMGTSGLGTFSLLFGILITANSVQTGWIGDSLTVLDRFDPGIRRALFQSQAGSVVIIGVVTTALASFVDGVDGTTALVFGVAAVAWAVEETFRRILIARREFWSLVANDGAFAAGSFGLLALVIVSGADVTMLTMMAALLAGAIVAIAVAVMQLPRIEVVRGPVAPSRMRELSSFAGWRAVQVGLRPGSLAAIRVIVAAAVSIEAVGELEAARLLIAPALTLVNGAGLYLLPTYADQVKRRVSFRPSVPRAMLVIGSIAAAYGAVAIVLRSVLVDVLTSGDTIVSTAAVASWVLYSIAFGVGLPAGSATVASGQSRRTFGVRLVDAVLGVALGSIFAVLGWVDAVPAGLAFGAFVGAWLLLRSLRRDAATERAAGPAEPFTTPTEALETPAPALAPAHWRWAPVNSPVLPASIPPPPQRPGRHARSDHPNRAERPMPVRRNARRRITIDWHRELLWIVPLVLIVATEFKFRRRSIDEALAGSIDVMIAVELVVCGIIGAWSLTRLVASKPRIEPLMMILWGYLLSTAASALYSPFPMLALARAVELVIIGAVVQLLSTEGGWSTISRLLHGWIVLISSSIVVGLAYVAPTTGPQEGRFTWLSVHSVSAGSMLAISTPVLFGLLLASGRRRLPWPRWVYGSLLLVHLTFLLLTRTRGSIGGAFVALAVMAWLSSGKRMKPELVLGSLVAGGALALAFGRPVLEFLTRGETVDQIGTFNRRTEIWSLAWDSFLQRPFFGLGFNSAKGVFFDETGLGGAHNSVINVMIDVGLVGLLWWFALVVGALVLLGRLRHRERRSPVLLRGATGTARGDELILIGVFVSLLINSITTEGLGAGVNVMAIWMFVAVAWLTILDRDQRSTGSAGRGELAREVRNRQLEPLA